MLGRILIIMALVFVGFWLLRQTLGLRKPKQPPATKDKDSPALVNCAHCGVHLPKSEAYWREGHSYCSLTHRNLGPRQKGQ